MSHLETLTQATGIGGVLIDFGADAWMDALIGAVALRGILDQDEIRIVTGDDTILVLRERDHVIAVVFPTGNAISKSIHRMMRKAIRGPVRVRSPRPIPTTTTTTTPAPIAAPGPITAADAFGG